jgi:hypothetical protein
VLWHLRTAPQLRQDYLEKLDRMTSFAGRGLLVPRLGIAASAPGEGISGLPLRAQ